MLQIELDAEVEQKLNEYADHEKLPMRFIVNEVMKRWIEDQEDYAAGVRALANMKYTISQEEMDRRAELAD